MNKMTKNVVLGFSIMAAGTALLRAQPLAPKPPSGVAVINASAPGVAAVAATNTLGPRIKFATPIADFGRVMCGEIVKQTYIFTNTGDQVLTLANVAPGCGCTAAGNWTKTVEPGNTGSIPIQLQTVNFNGPVTKFVTVTCNDKTQPTTILQLKGTIWKAVEISPPNANFSITADGQNTSTTLKITNNTEEPLILFPPTSNNSALAAEIRTNVPGRGYDLIITRLPPLSPGAIQGQITIKTSFTNPPVLLVSVWADVKPPVLVTPVQLALPQAPLPATRTFTVTIQNFTTNALVLSDPAVSDPKVSLQMKELQPGRYFNAMLAFPQGYEIARDQQVEFSVKTSNPKVPIVKVPILQQPRPTPPANPPQPAAKHVLPPLPPVPPRAAAQ